jgi:hypothetical protein
MESDPNVTLQFHCGLFVYEALPSILAQEIFAESFVGWNRNKLQEVEDYYS